jgi:hypothetical protein
MFGPEMCRVNDRLRDSERAARSFKVLCGWSVVKAKTEAPEVIGRRCPETVTDSE